MPVFIAKHLVYHDGKKYARGSRITLTDKQAAPLLGKSIVPEADAAPVPLVPVLGASTLGKLTKEELIAHAAAAGVTHAPDANKELLLAAFQAHVEALAEPKE